MAKTNTATQDLSKFSAKEKALITEANAKAKAKGADKELQAAQAKMAKAVAAAPAIKAATKAKAEAHIASSAKKVDEPKAVTKVPAHAAANATEKAPHTKRALLQNAEAAKLAKAEQAMAEAETAMKAAEANAHKVKRAKGHKDPATLDAFRAKLEADNAYIAARKAVQKLKRELETPEAKAEREAAQAKAPKPAAAKTPRAPRVATNRTIKPGATVYANAKGGWTLYMVTLTLKHKDTDSATAAHKAGAAKAGQPADKPLDFKWMDAKGYIKLG